MSFAIVCGIQKKAESGDVVLMFVVCCCLLFNVLCLLYKKERYNENAPLARSLAALASTLENTRKTQEHKGTKGTQDLNLPPEML